MFQTQEARIVGEWRIEERIGSGSFSVVWKAVHRRRKQLAAIKEISKEKVTPAIAKCIESELSFLEKAHHPNIVAFYEKIESDSALFIVMEYCKDGDLETIMQKGPCEETFTQNCMIQLAAGLQELRFMGLIHRDLKPANLLLADGILKIADFGFARSLQPTRLADTLCGSPLYMAPEVLQLKKYDARADLWSVGVIMYEMLVGKTPFDGQTYIHLLKNIETTKIRIPKLMLQRTTQDCMDLMVRLLQRDPSKRIDFDEFFKHRFIVAGIKNCSNGIEPQHDDSERAQNQSSFGQEVHVEQLALKIGKAAISGSRKRTEEELAYSSDEEFVIVYHKQKHYSSGTGQSITAREVEASHKTELEAKLIRVADYIGELAEARAYGNLIRDAFYLCTIRLQIIDYLVSNGISDTKLIVKKEEIINSATRFSAEINDEKKCSNKPINLYGMIFDHALACSKGATGAELNGQNEQAVELYSKSIELLLFLVNQGYKIALEYPLQLSELERERTQKLIIRIEDRQSQCKI